MPTHLIGAALLRGEWKTAVDLILDPREGDILKILLNLVLLCSNFNAFHALYYQQILFSITLFKQRADTRKVREQYKKTGDIDSTLRQLPRYMVAERAIVSFFM